MSEDQLRLTRAAPVPHTPGPWRVARQSSGHGWSILGPSPREHDRPMEWFVARTVSDEPEDEGNARLLSVAPVMLQALREVAGDCYVLHRDDDRPHCRFCDGAEGEAHDADCTIHLVQIAIAQAEGR